MAAQTEKRLLLGKHWFLLRAMGTMTDSAVVLLQRGMYNLSTLQLLSHGGMAIKAKETGFLFHVYSLIRRMGIMTGHTFSFDKGIMRTGFFLALRQSLMTFDTQTTIFTCLTEQFFYPALVRFMAFTALTHGKGTMEAKAASLSQCFNVAFLANLILLGNQQLSMLGLMGDMTRITITLGSRRMLVFPRGKI